MLKLKIAAVITIILGLISLGWIFYDYLALADISYNYGADLVSKRRIVTLGFIPVILFHFAFFGTMYLLFDFLKKQKLIIKEHTKMKAEAVLKPAADSKKDALRQEMPKMTGDAPKKDI